MSKLVFDWKDEDAGALIVMVLALAFILFTPWHACTATNALTGKVPAASSSTPAPSP
ncbi:MAG: hypothetical protein AAFS10_11475 [Myxococcota bacterium]